MYSDEGKTETYRRNEASILLRTKTMLVGIEEYSVLIVGGARGIGSEEGDYSVW